MRIIFSAGGTGGHLYPALALAKYIKEIDPAAEILFVGSKYRIENTVVEQYGFAFKGLDIKTPSGNILSKSKGYLDVLKNVKVSQKIIRTFKPDIVFGFGGYTSFSILEAALKEKIPTIIHEQNSVVGKSNKYLAPKVNAVVSVFDVKSQIKNSKVYQLGNPVIYNASGAQVVTLKDYELSEDKQSILIVMGSQGSQTIDNQIRDMLEEFSQSPYQVIYLCGNDYIKENDANLKYDNIKIKAYEENLSSLIKCVDLVVSRAGASSLSEIAFALKPSILIPSIYVTDNHQYKNALTYVNAGCSIICEENENLKENLKLEIDHLFNHPELLIKMSKQANQVNYNNVIIDIYKLMLKVVGEKDE